MTPGMYAQISTAGGATSEILWISNAPAPDNLLAAIHGRHRLRPVALNSQLSQQLERGQQLAILYLSGAELTVRRISLILDELDRFSCVAMVILPPGSTLGPLIRRQGPFIVSAFNSQAEVFAAQIAAMLQFQPVIQNLHKELTQIRTFGNDIGATLNQIDEEMRLAARLQRDFLPKSLPAVGPLRFATLFRPATWVSGDIYDLVRLDEDHVGLHVADAVGHGMPAALLTMFIKRALPTKRIVQNSYEIVSPESAIEELNNAIYAQNLTSCQFCTAVYCVINARTLMMTYARGGHPQPILLRADGGTMELDSAGGLLGIFEDETFALGRQQLMPGDRMILHSDGVEGAFRCEGSGGRSEFLQAIEKYRHLPVEELMLELTGLIDSQQGSLHPEDDVTVLAMEVHAA